MLLCLTASSFARDDGKNVKLLRSMAITPYLDALTGTFSKELRSVFDENLRVFTTTESGTRVLNKDETLRELQNFQHSVQNCKLSYSLVEDCSYQSVIKIMQTYELFTKVSYVTLNYTKNGWKISSISNHYD